MDRVEFIAELGLANESKAILIVQYFNELMAFYNIVVDHMTQTSVINYSIDNDFVKLHIHFVDKDSDRRIKNLKEKLHNMAPIITIYGSKYLMEINVDRDTMDADTEVLCISLKPI